MLISKNLEAWKSIPDTFNFLKKLDPAISTIFSSAYACELLFSEMENIKDSLRNHLVDDSNSACILLKVTSYNPNISYLSSYLLQQKSHSNHCVTSTRQTHKRCLDDLTRDRITGNVDKDQSVAVLLLPMSPYPQQHQIFSSHQPHKRLDGYFEYPAPVAKDTLGRLLAAHHYPSAKIPELLLAILEEWTANSSTTH
ncbi:dimer_Tnp_hAT domain-containing protein [Trichonephila clavipes]|nr:dimer_Tnp_hAT domain-containing protein [Trichonephila clavipes]